MQLFAIAAALCFVSPTLSLVEIYSPRDGTSGQTGTCNGCSDSAPDQSETYTVWYDIIYDQKKNPLSSVACSNGEYGLLTQGYTTFDSIPSYPFIGGAPLIQSWDSPNCGTCWELTYTNPNGATTSLSFTAINTGPPNGGFSISSEGMNRLTNGNAQSLDGASVTVAQLPASACGM